MSFAHPLFEDLQARGLIYQATDTEGLGEALSQGASFYVGFDPTALDLHLGHYAMILLMRKLQRAGAKPVVLVGGATAMIGDPSGKSKERILLNAKTVECNKIAIKALFSRFLSDFVMVDNYDWFSNMSAIDFLRDVGSYFRIGTMLSRESVKQRIESEEGLSFTEFSYQLLQGYDFVHLAKKEGVVLQCGGSDQWGNIISGIELGQKMGLKLYGFTLPLITTSDGKKLGKTESGTALWLSDFEKGPYLIYQYLLNIPDPDIFPLFKRLTEWPIEQIEALEKEGRHPNLCKKELAQVVVEDIFGKALLEKAVTLTHLLAPGSLQIPSSREEFELIERVAFHLCRKIDESQRTFKFADMLVALGIFSSKGEVSRLAMNKGLFLNGTACADPSLVLGSENFLYEKYLLVGKGKKEKFLIVFDA